MDIVRLTIFLMVSLLSFQICIGKPAITKDSKTWPCPKNHAFCTVKPDDYPSREKLIRLYNTFKDKVPKLNETSDRQGGKSDCAAYDYLVEEYYMIIDQNKNIRYVLYLPGYFTFPLNVQECRPDAPRKIELELTHRRCETGYSDRVFFVLTDDLEGLETARSATGIPTSCTAVQYDDDY
ncbi:uncharacterized protein LOC125224679 isoform X2 [Leguminivora glycinivorella]|uniref:uncharacterized protein LOC125224679 isoform X2 n=1 Tax=Leguminivora glycinivorella TaxID=1035111 RepID=UPI00200F3C6F|nr:uncharacterized protein LOC125224679 isoform X2 [Leguminivora glycinivorella]